MTTTVTSTAGEAVELLDERELRELMDYRGPQGAFTTIIKPDERRVDIVRALWTGGVIEQPQGFATNILCERLPHEPSLRTLIPRLGSPLLKLCVARKTQGKRTYRIALQAMPRTWYERFDLAHSTNGPDGSTIEAQREAIETTRAALDVEPVPDLPAQAPVDVVEFQVAAAVASALLTQVVEIIIAGNGGGQTLSRLRTDIEDLQARLGQQVGYVSSLRRDLRQAQDDVLALTVERDGLRQRVRAAEHNLKVATSADAQRLIDREVHKQVDRLMRQTPGDVHARHDS